MRAKSWLDRLPAGDLNMTKRTLYTIITPLPATVSRQTALDFVHDHQIMIELNPMVIGHTVTDPPPNASPEEAKSCTWYAITDKISYIPGGPAKSEVTYKGGFYDLPHGLQTHVFAPGGVDIRALWKVGGSLPGEPREPVELGVSTPRDGLYLREDVDLRCNVFLSNFVKRNMKKSHAVMVDRLLAKAEEVQTSRQPPERPTMQARVRSMSESDLRTHAKPVHSGEPVSPVSPLPPEIDLTLWDYVPRRQESATQNTARTPYTKYPVDHGPANGVNTVPGADIYRPFLAHLHDVYIPSPTLHMQTPAETSFDDSPLGQHPCFCDGGVHVHTCQYYPGLVRPAAKKFPRPRVPHHNLSTQWQLHPSYYQQANEWQRKSFDSSVRPRSFAEPLEHSMMTADPEPHDMSPVLGATLSEYRPLVGETDHIELDGFPVASETQYGHYAWQHEYKELD